MFPIFTHIKYSFEFLISFIKEETMKDFSLYAKEIAINIQMVNIRHIFSKVFLFIDYSLIYSLQNFVCRTGNTEIETNGTILLTLAVNIIKSIDEKAAQTAHTKCKIRSGSFQYLSGHENTRKIL